MSQTPYAVAAFDHLFPATPDEESFINLKSLLFSSHIPPIDHKLLIPAFMFSEASDAPPSIPSMLFGNLLELAENQWFDLSTIQEFLQGHPALIPLLSEEAEDFDLMQAWLTWLYRNREPVARFMAFLDRMNLSGPEKKVLLKTVFSMAQHWETLAKEAFNVSILQSSLETHPILIPLLSGLTETPDVLEGWLMRIYSDPDKLNLFMACLFSASISREDTKTLLRILFSIKYYPLAQALIQFGSEEINLFIMLMAVFKENPESLEWMLEFQQLTALDDDALAVTLELASRQFDYITLIRQMKLNKRFFLMHLLRRLRALHFAPFSKSEHQISEPEKLLAAFRRVGFNQHFAPLFSDSPEDELQQFYELLISLLLHNQHLLHLVLPIPAQQNSAAGARFLNNLLKVETDIVPLLELMLAVPQWIPFFIQQGASSIDQMHSLASNATDNLRLQETLIKQSQNAPEPGHSPVAVQQQPPPPPESYAALLATFEAEDSEAYELITTSPIANSLLQALFEAQGETPWITSSNLVMAAHLLEETDLEQPQNRIMFLLRLLRLIYQQGVCQLHELSEPPELIRLLTTMMQDLLPLDAQDDPNVLARLLLELMQHLPQVMAELSHPGITLGSLAPASILAILDQLLVTNRESQDTVNHFLRLLLAHIGILIPVEVVLMKKPDLLAILQSLHAIFPEQLTNMTTWELQLFNLGVYALLHPDLAFQKPETDHAGLISYLAEQMDTVLPQASHLAPQIASFLLRRVPQLRRAIDFADIDELLKKEFQKNGLQQKGFFY